MPRGLQGSLERRAAVRGERGVYRWRLRVNVATEDGRQWLNGWHTGTETEAKKALRKFVADVEAGRRRPVKQTVKEALDAYVAEADLAPKTAVETERMIRLHLAPLHDVRLAALTPAQIDKLYRDLLAGNVKAPASQEPAGAEPQRRGTAGSHRVAASRYKPRPLSPATVHRTHHVLHAALERCVRLDLLQSNPAARVRLPSAQTQAPTVDTAAVLRLIDASKRSPILHAFVVCAAATGCRRGELAAWRWSDVQPERGTVRVERSMSYLGRGGMVLKAPKSGKARTVALEPAAVDVLRAWRQTQRAVGAPTPLDGGWVFSHDGREPWGPIAAETAWRRLCRQEGVHLRLHALRHWSASAHLEAGATVAEVAGMLGHSSPHVTLSTYSHVLTSTRRQVLGDAIASAQVK